MPSIARSLNSLLNAGYSLETPNHGILGDEFHQPLFGVSDEFVGFASSNISSRTAARRSTACSL
jgi:hypothetical protein